MVVVTDGRETSGTDVKSALPLLREAGVVVSFVVLGGPPSTDLEHLAQSTGREQVLHVFFFHGALRPP